MTAFLLALEIAALCAVAAAAARDMEDRIIPNVLVLVVLAAGVLIRIADGHIFASIAAATGLFLLFLPLVHRDVMGAGDAKMIAACVLLVPPSGIGDLLLAIAASGGALSAVYMIKGWLAPVRERASDSAALAPLASVQGGMWSESMAVQIPYGVAILAGLTIYSLWRT